MTWSETEPSRAKEKTESTNGRNVAADSPLLTPLKSAHAAGAHNQDISRELGALAGDLITRVAPHRDGLARNLSASKGTVSHQSLREDNKNQTDLPLLDLSSIGLEQLVRNGAVLHEQEEGLGLSAIVSAPRVCLPHLLFNLGKVVGCFKYQHHSGLKNSQGNPLKST